MIRSSMVGCISKHKSCKIFRNFIRKYHENQLLRMTTRINRQKTHRQTPDPFPSILINQSNTAQKPNLSRDSEHKNTIVKKYKSNSSSMLTYLPEEKFQPQHDRALKSSAGRQLTRDFIHDSLYNTEYGYFSKRALIFSYPEDIDFKSLSSMDDFHQQISDLYQEYDEAEGDDAAQVWHTPTEIFKPWYGYALANYILQEYEKMPKSGPLIIYEMGAGNGTLMGNILDYVKNYAPDIYKNMNYNIIEISRQLSERQEWNNMSQLDTEVRKHPNVRIINQSIFDWQEKVNENCFFIALEVIVRFIGIFLRVLMKFRITFPMMR